jgi:HK97 family phage prohead protease
MNLIGQDDFRAALRNGTVRGSGVTHPARVVRAQDDGSRVVRFVFSDGSVDRMGDTIDPNGWDLTAYKRSPVVLFAHDSSAPPIGRTVSVWSDGTRLLGDIEFAPPEIYEFAETIYRLIVGGYLRSGSVGFQPIEYEWADDDERPYGINFKRQELCEFSIVPVPANVNALTEARAKGLLSKGDFIRLRRRLVRRDDDATPAGNCGRPVGDECGMKDPAECSIHGFGSAGTGTDDEAESRRLRARVARARLARPLRLAAGEEAAQTRADRRARAATLRGLHRRQPDPRVVARQAAFRLGWW